MTGYAQGAHDNADYWRERAERAEAEKDEFKGLVAHGWTLWLLVRLALTTPQE